MADEPGTAPLIAALLSAADHGSCCRGSRPPSLDWVEVTHDDRLRARPARHPGAGRPGARRRAVPSRGRRGAVRPGPRRRPHGGRLGQGGGYYDKALADVPAYVDGGPLRVAVLFDDEVRRRPVPSDASTTASSTLVLTPRGVVRLPPG